MSEINIEIYDQLGDDWYDSQTDPIALLRAEARVRDAWIASHLESKKFRILDIGCGAGFCANELAKRGHEVVGIDQSPKSLEVARSRDTSRTVDYIEGNAENLPFSDDSFDVICALDFLEHVPNPRELIREWIKFLRPGGQFFFHTFNRNIISWLLAAKGIEWFVKDSPKNIHLYRYFIRPAELESWLSEFGMSVPDWTGIRPRFESKSFWKLLWTRTVPKDFQFQLTNSLMVSYLGRAIAEQKH